MAQPFPPLFLFCCFFILPVPGTIVFPNWTWAGKSPCERFGHTCDDAGHVVSVHLSAHGLTGTFPVTEMTAIMPTVKTLDLSANKISGTITNIFAAGCQSLQLFNVSYNFISGAVPADLARCPHLRVLDLQGNHLTGGLPAEFLNTCNSLAQINLGMNQVTGKLPSVDTDCSPLSVLRLDGNHLHGQLPVSLGRLMNLTRLSLSNNSFSGAIPTELGHLKKLQVVSLSDNSLTGTLPVELGQIAKLRMLALQNNLLTGQIPSDLGSLESLEILDLSNNSLTGPFPPSLCRLPALRMLLLAENTLSGAIPSVIGDLKELQILDLSSNNLTGNIPATVGKLQRLLWFSVSANRLHGVLPLDMCNCSSLVWFSAGNNRLTGRIPTSIWRLGQRANETFALNRRRRHLTPVEYNPCSAIARWVPCESFFLIPPTKERNICNRYWGDVFKGTLLTIAPCPVTDDTPSFIELRGNRLYGVIPPSFSRFPGLGGLFLRSNRLTGGVPEALSRLPLRILDLSQNRLTGRIPDFLGDICCLTLLDLSRNDFSGVIPPSLQKLMELAAFNVSFNPKLSGAVPTGGQFSAFTAESYLGNSDLSMVSRKEWSLMYLRGQQHENSWSFSLDTAQKKMKRQTRLQLGTILVIMAIVLECLIIYGLCRRKQGREHRKPSDTGCVDFYARSSIKITYRDIAEATGDFDSSRVIGAGGFGIIYRGDLHLPGLPASLPVAVKRLLQNESPGEREFLTESKTLSGLCHESLVPLIAACVYGPERLLVYKYMANGSLEARLHSPAFARRRIWDFRQRVQIALDVAQGLRYLHEECRPVVVHRDVKASNVLLDEELRAVLSDFGLARLVRSDKDHVTTTLAGTPGYVPPEYGQNWQVTAAGDVYSFGVVMWELVTGRPPVVEEGESEARSTVEWARMELADRHAEGLVDPALTRNVFDRDGSLKSAVVDCMRVAFLCTHDSPLHRPSMGSVAGRLDGVLRRLET